MCCEILLILVWNTGVLTQWYGDILNRDIQMSWGGGTPIYGLPYIGMSHGIRFGLEVLDP